MTRRPAARPRTCDPDEAALANKAAALLLEALVEPGHLEALLNWCTRDAFPGSPTGPRPADRYRHMATHGVRTLTGKTLATQAHTLTGDALTLLDVPWRYRTAYPHDPREDPYRPDFCLDNGAGYLDQPPAGALPHARGHGRATLRAQEQAARRAKRLHRQHETPYAVLPDGKTKTPLHTLARHLDQMGIRHRWPTPGHLKAHLDRSERLHGPCW